MAQVTDFSSIDTALDSLEAALTTAEGTASGDIQEGQPWRERYERAKRAAERLGALMSPNGYNRINRLQEVY